MTHDVLRQALTPLQDREVVLYGSVLNDRFNPRSDIDVAVMTREPDRERNQATWLHLLGLLPDRFDVRVFELLPLPVQIDIADHHEVVYGDPVEISWYLYRYRRRWKDQAPRIHANRFKGIHEKRAALRNRRR